MILYFLLSWHRQVFRSSVLKLELCPPGIFQNNFFSCADVPFLQKLTLVKTRERRGVEGMEQGMSAVMFEEGA